MHHIQHYALTQLSITKWARFSELRPPGTDSNLYSYHLKLLIRQKLIEKHPEKGYRLSPLGLSQVDRMSTNELQIRIQPKIITMCLVYNEVGQLLLLKKSKQPFIGAWTFVSGKLHLEDGGARAAMTREIRERIDVDTNETLTHNADAYLSVSIDGQLVSTVLSHIFTMTIRSDEVKRKDVSWSNLKERSSMQLAPGVAEICNLVEANPRTFSFAEYHIDW
jgi:ADP-ribose pyrophosphatase YjhB (NUDIX family)